MAELKNKLYVLLWQSKGNVWPVAFYYQPSEKLPYPDTSKIVDAMKIDFKPEEGEKIQIYEIEGKIPMASYKNGLGSTGDPEFLTKPLLDAVSDQE
jgi:hypothetical protein